MFDDLTSKNLILTNISVSVRRTLFGTSPNAFKSSVPQTYKKHINSK